ncbi:MAG TPA: MEKHLA domain-containing protein [Novosphingobium sp.]
MQDLPQFYRDPALTAKIALIAESFVHLLGYPLVEADRDPIMALWEIPKVVVAHGAQEDPIFFFGNAQALAAFECDVATFTTMPSRLSAEAPARSERQKLLDRVSRNGFIDDYAGVRISSKGRRFHIERATVWNLMDVEGNYHGQAATFTL